MGCAWGPPGEEPPVPWGGAFCSLRRSLLFLGEEHRVPGVTLPAGAGDRWHTQRMTKQGRDPLRIMGRFITRNHEAHRDSQRWKHPLSAPPRPVGSERGVKVYPGAPGAGTGGEGCSTEVVGSDRPPSGREKAGAGITQPLKSL